MKFKTKEEQTIILNDMKSKAKSLEDHKRLLLFAAKFEDKSLVMETIDTIIGLEDSSKNNLIKALLIKGMGQEKMFDSYLSNIDFKLTLAKIIEELDFFLKIEMPKKINNIAEETIIVILGEKLVDGEINSILKERLDEVVVSTKGLDNKIIVSGGGTPEVEAKKMSEYLISKGIKKKRIIKEDKSVCLIENIVNSLELIKANKNVICVTSDYHISRAMLVFQEVLSIIKKKVTIEGVGVRSFSEKEESKEKFAAYRNYIEVKNLLKL